MSSLIRLAAAVVLTLALGLSTFAGETNSPPCAPGETHTPPCSSEILIDGFGEIQSPPSSRVLDPRSLAEIALSMLWLF